MKKYKNRFVLVATLLFMMIGSSAFCQNQPFSVPLSGPRGLEILRAKLPDSLFLFSRAQVDQKDFALKLCTAQNQLLMAENGVLKSLEGKSKSILGKYELLDINYQQDILNWNLERQASKTAQEKLNRKANRQRLFIKISLPLATVLGVYLGTKL